MWEPFQPQLNCEPVRASASHINVSTACLRGQDAPFCLGLCCALQRSCICGELKKSLGEFAEATPSSFRKRTVTLPRMRIWCPKSFEDCMQLLKVTHDLDQAFGQTMLGRSKITFVEGHSAWCGKGFLGMLCQTPQAAPRYP